MKVFISWSEERSKKAAELLVDWLPQVIQSVEPWISIDIAKGARSTPEISSELEKSKVGIICLTPENLDNNWILFEAGALSKIRDTKVCTYLLDLKPADIKPPLSQFQHTLHKKEDIFRLISTINQQVNPNERPVPDRTLHQVFNRCWPEFNDGINKIIKSRPEQSKQIRSDRDILEEILEVVRVQEQKIVKKKIPDIVNELFVDADKKYLRLVNDFGIEPSEAKKSAINEIERETPLTPILIKAISAFLDENWKRE